MDRQTNSLHIIAGESFAEFASSLQGEIEMETGVKFGVLDVASFMDIEVPVEVACKIGIEIPEAPPLELPTYVPKPKPEAQADESTEVVGPASEQPKAPAFVKLGYEDSAKIFESFKQQGLLDHANKIKPIFVDKIEQGTFTLPEVYQPIANAVIDRVRQANEKIEIRNDLSRVTVRQKKQVFVSPEFAAIWDRIKHKTTYRIQRDMDAYISMASERIKLMAPIQKARIVATTASIEVAKSGVKARETHVRAMEVGAQEVSLPNILGLLRDASRLSKRTILSILIQSGRLDDFANNPERFIEQVTEILSEVGSGMQIDGIRYQRIAGKEYYVQEIFDKDELTAYLDSNAVKVEHSVYDYAIVDSMGVEKRFAEALDNDPDVKLFFKLPDKFEIETPIGNYRPDWAVVVDMHGEGEKLYFVIETKGSMSKLDLRGREDLKIQYGRKHFEALGGAEFELTKDWREFKASL